MKRVEVVGFLLKEDDETSKHQVLLGLKTQKTGKGKWNGYGGGVEKKETFAGAMAREFDEELGIEVKPSDLEEVAFIKITFRINFYKINTCKLHVFILRRWRGAFTNSNEMLNPTWYNIDNLPDNMIASDKLWLPFVLEGAKVLGIINKKFKNNHFEVTHFNVIRI